MNDAAVQGILDQIEQLPDEDRILLHERLAQLYETEWKQESDIARQQARHQGLDQATIDRAIQELRYPR